MVHARMDVQRFASVNQAKGAWSLLEQLAWAPAASVAAAADVAATVSVQPARRAAAAARTPARPGMSLEAVQKVVREAVISILGTEPEGETLLDHLPEGLVSLLAGPEQCCQRL